MEICFLGVGEACDARQPNTSIHVKTAGNERILLDCGFTVPHNYFALCDDPDELDAVWISHFHGDHFFGIPLLLLRFWQMGRSKPLQICGQAGIKEKIVQVMELAYPDFLRRLKFRLEIVELEPEGCMKTGSVLWKTAENVHSQRCLSVRIEDDSHSLFYSGDGKPTAKTLALASGCDLIIHESFWMNNVAPGHGNVKKSLEFAEKAKAKNLALVHVDRTERGEQYDRIVAAVQSVSFNAFLPESGDIFYL
ncbi:MAG: MBL fold metallo-hydrolase [Desulfobulbaceae bacterium]|uniref:MBL fold metallo-hydrolase n=1 Tax=Candidatus Desulfobia pelagia TaxID=2841692 RepID=A0A8J6NAF4_9BACT|nr:MBL fold metallo-hydrolase [Candidatus Desulfobia pelagia]